MCEQTEHVVTVCGCSGVDCVDERMEGSAALLKQTSRTARELIGQVSECVACGQGQGLRVFGWTRGSASDAQLVHDRDLDRADRSVSSEWRFTLNKPLRILASAASSS